MYAMLRPTNRITYELTAADMEIILTDMQQFFENGIDGFVFGALKKIDASNQTRDIDIESCYTVMRNSHNLPVTFHRAIDMTDVAKKKENLNKIQECGFKRVLSSGFAETAQKGIENLIEMQTFAKKRCIIMPGCGITVSNVDEILERSKWSEFHASARIKKVPEIIDLSESTYQKECLRNNPFYVTSEEIVRKLVESGNRWNIR